MSTNGDSPARFFCTGVIVLAFLGARSASAQSDCDSGETDRLIEEGIELRQQGSNDTALQRFERAHALCPDGRSFGQLGLAHQALGEWALAHANLSAALRAGGEWVDGFREQLQQAVAFAEQHVGFVEIRSSASEGRILIDGREVAQLPLTEPIPVRAGNATLRLEAAGFEPVERTLVIVAGQRTVETITLLEPGETSEGSGESRGRQIAAVMSIAVGGVSLVGSLVAYGIAVLRQNQYNDPSCVVPDGGTRGETCGHRRSQSITARNASLGTAVVGAGFAITGVILFLRPHNDEVDAHACGPGPGLIGVSCSASF